MDQLSYPQRLKDGGVGGDDFSRHQTECLAGTFIFNVFVRRSKYLESWQFSVRERYGKLFLFLSDDKLLYVRCRINETGFNPNLILYAGKDHHQCPIPSFLSKRVQDKEA